jgi:serine/threonine protein kinase
LVDERSDLFSLGSVMYAMSAGRPPFRAETSYGVLRRICEDEPRPLQEVNPQVPDWLSAIVERLHQKLPQDRFQSAEEVAHLLEQCLAHVQQPGASPLPASLSKPVRKAKHDRRRWMFAGGALSALVLVAVAIAVAAASWWFTPPQRSGASGAAVRVGSQSAREPAAKSAATSADESSPADDWEGGITSEIEGLRSDVDELERRAAQLWDEAAVSP